MRHSRTIVCLLLGVGITLAGCARNGPEAPGIVTPDSGSSRYGKFVWYDLITEDLPGIKRFYGELLGWTFAETEIPTYTLIRHKGRAIGGIVDVANRNPDISESQWVSVLSVKDVELAAKATKAAGGVIHVKPFDLPGRGRLAVVSDPQGAVVAYLRATGGDPPDRTPEPGDWMWTELWTADVEASSSFYQHLVNYELDRETILEDVEYVFFKHGSMPRAGVIPRHDENVRSHWIPYVRVDDPAALAKRVERLGGKVLLAPSGDVRKGTVAVVMDPSGAALALQKWERS